MQEATPDPACICCESGKDENNAHNQSDAKRMKKLEKTNKIFFIEAVISAILTKTGNETI